MQNPYISSAFSNTNNAADGRTIRIVFKDDNGDPLDPGETI